jgi:hypothetical protein
MKSLSTFLKLKATVVGFFLFVLLYLSACDITDPTEGIRAIINTKERTTTVSVIFRDSATQEPIGFSNNTTVNVTVTGRDADKVIDLINNPKVQFESAKGFLSFALADNIVPSENNALEFNIVARANGYITTSVPVTINEKQNTPIEVNMVNTSQLPRGVNGEVNRNVGAAVNGRLTTPQAFGTTADATTNTRTNFQIAQNTLIRDAAGNNLTGILSADFHTFNSRDTESLQSFPGGFSAQVENSPNGAERVVFTTGGFTSVTITDQSGRRARTFDPPIQVSMELDSQVRDHSNNVVSVGSQVPIWSFDDETGTWAFEQNATVTQGANGNLEVVFEADHLSWWNIDWYGASCYMGTRVNLLGNNSQMKGKLLRADNGAFLGWAASRNVSNSSNFIQFLWAPVGIAGVLELYNMNEVLLETVNLPNMCSSTPVDVNLGASPQLTVIFRGVGVCPNNDDVEIRPSFPAFYKPAIGNNWLSAGTVVNGELSITLPGQGNYTFGAYYEGQFYQYTLDLTSAVDGQVYEEIVDLPSNVCSGL